MVVSDQVSLVGDLAQQLLARGNSHRRIDVERHRDVWVIELHGGYVDRGAGRRLPVGFRRPRESAVDQGRSRLQDDGIDLARRRGHHRRYATFGRIRGRSREAENLLSPRFLDRAHELVAIGTYVIDLHSRTIRLSSRMAQLLGAGDGPLEMLLDDYRARFYYPEDRAEQQANADHSYAVGEPLLFEARVRRADGSSMWVRASSSTEQDEQGRACVIGVIQDITAHKQAELSLRQRENQLRESEELFRATFDHAHIGVTLVSTEGRFLRVNPALCRMLGYSAEELTQLCFNDVTYPEDKQIGSEILAQALADGPAHGEFGKRYLHKAGHIVWAHVATALVSADLGAAASSSRISRTSPGCAFPKSVFERSLPPCLRRCPSRTRTTAASSMQTASSSVRLAGRRRNWSDALPSRSASGVTRACAPRACKASASDIWPRSAS